MGDFNKVAQVTELHLRSAAIEFESISSGKSRRYRLGRCLLSKSFRPASHRHRRAKFGLSRSH